MTNYYQPLDCTTNKWAKDFLKAKFSTWFSKQVQKHLDKGIALEDINIRFQLRTIKLLHANWVIDLYELTSPQTKDVIIGGWKKSGIWDALKLGSRGLPSVDLFKEIQPMDSDYIVQIDIDPVAKDNMILLWKKKYVTRILWTLNGKKLMIEMILTFLMNRDFFRFNRDVF